MGANHETIDRSTAVESVFDFRTERPLLKQFGTGADGFVYAWTASRQKNEYGSPPTG